jgi:hypothetical protein
MLIQLFGMVLFNPEVDFERRRLSLNIFTTSGNYNDILLSDADIIGRGCYRTWILQRCRLKYDYHRELLWKSKDSIFQMKIMIRLLPTTLGVVESPSFHWRYPETQRFQSRGPMFANSRAAQTMEVSLFAFHRH